MLALRSEDDIYDQILEFYTKQKDVISIRNAEIWKDLTINRLLYIFKKRGRKCDDVVRNSILLLLALDSSPNKGVELYGSDVYKLNKRELTQILQDLKKALSISG